jgi:hypothetical protein
MGLFSTVMLVTEAIIPHFSPVKKSKHSLFGLKFYSFVAQIDRIDAHIQADQQPRRLDSFYRRYPRLRLYR